MSSLPTEIFSNITNFLPNDDITDLMLLSRKFNSLVTPRLKKIDEEMSTMNQSIKSFMPSPAPDRDSEWVPKLNLKKLQPVGSAAKKRMKEFFESLDGFRKSLYQLSREPETVRIDKLKRLKERLSLERFDDATFFRILAVFVITPKIRKEYNVSNWDGQGFIMAAGSFLPYLNFHEIDDLHRIYAFYHCDTLFDAM